jgi:hypothetical protein
MQTTQAPPRLPGVRATTLFLIGALVLPLFLLLFLLLLVPLIGLMTVEATQVGGHLPWPVAQWALTTPAGLVGILAICVGVGAPAFIVGQRHFLRGWTLARAVDVTEVPPWVWLTRSPIYPGETRAERWLGRSRRAQMVSLTLLGGVGADLPAACCELPGCSWRRDSGHPSPAMRSRWMPAHVPLDPDCLSGRVGKHRAPIRCAVSLAASG